uniref:Uncharacterized protein n=1 Tax=Alexandrium catenella TaxID=2925 RepID=A0A7S1PQU5_ALECA|mmetsp:Transcript_107704/g.286705  ORF Transcript_107704/g.286705 Transcript_107704/m.286705 type:complete len:168 (+) Transcript_107704:106-609(+)
MSSSSGSSDDHSGRALRSKGLLPAIGVGATVYFVTGLTSLSTLGLVGVGAGIGYGVGSWIADKFQKKQEAVGGQQGGGVAVDQLPWAVQVALQQWQDFVMRRAEGQQLSQADVDRLWTEFEQIEPTHAMNARALVRGATPQPSYSAAPVTASAGPGTTFVAPQAAEV